MHTSTADAEDRLAVTTEDAGVTEAGKVPAASVAAISAGRSVEGQGRTPQLLLDGFTRQTYALPVSPEPSQPFRPPGI